MWHLKKVFDLFTKEEDYDSENQQDVLLEPLQKLKHNIKHYGANDVLEENPLRKYKLCEKTKDQSKIQTEILDDYHIENEVTDKPSIRRVHSCIQNISAEHVPDDNTIVVHVDLHIPVEDKPKQLAVNKLSATTDFHDNSSGSSIKRRKLGIVHHDPLLIFTEKDNEQTEKKVKAATTTRLALLSNPNVRRSLDIFGHKPQIGEEIPSEDSNVAQVIDGHEQIPLHIIHRRDSTAEDSRGLFHSSLRLEKKEYTHPLPLEKCPQQKKRQTRRMIMFTKDMVMRMEIQALLATTLAVCLWLPPAVTSVTFKLHMCACILLMTCSSIMISLFCVY